MVMVMVMVMKIMRVLLLLMLLLLLLLRLLGEEPVGQDGQCSQDAPGSLPGTAWPEARKLRTC